MFRADALNKMREEGFPRIRGDVPKILCQTTGDPQFSPHTRGCSKMPPVPYLEAAVFPAYAGMFRWGLLIPKTCQRFPRIRGDVPVS